MELVLGTAQMGMGYGINNKTGKISAADAVQILEYAYTRGVRTLDTAEAYGTAHQVIGEYHRLNQGQPFNIITKLPKSTTSGQLNSKIDQYLNDLKVSSISVLMCHDFVTYRQDQGLASRIREGQLARFVKKTGVSVYTNEQISDLLGGEKKTDVIQLPYNLLDNKFQRGQVLEKLNANGVLAHTRSPFLQGLFFLDEKSNDRTYKYLSAHIEHLKKIAKAAGVSMQALALQYSYLNPFSECVILGVDSIDQIKMNLDIISGQFIPQEVVNMIDRIRVADVDFLNPSLWN